VSGQEIGQPPEIPAVVEDVGPLDEQIDDKGVLLLSPTGLAGQDIECLLEVAVGLLYRIPVGALLTRLNKIVESLVEGLALLEMEGQAFIELLQPVRVKLLDGLSYSFMDFPVPPAFP